MNDETLIETIVTKLEPILKEYQIETHKFKSIRKLDSFILNFIQTKKHSLNKLNILVLKTCSQDIRLYTVRKQLYKLKIEREYIKNRKLVDYYNKINNTYFNELGYPKSTFIVETQKIYSCKKTKLQIMADYFWLCKIEINSDEFKDNYKSILNIAKSSTSENDLGYQIYKVTNKRPANMSLDDYNNHWRRLKDNYNGSVNYIRSLPKSELIHTRQSRIKVKMITLYSYVYKSKHRDILKKLDEVHNQKSDNLAYNLSKISEFVEKHRVYDNLVESKTFTKNICKLVYILKKRRKKNHGTRSINSKPKSRRKSSQKKHTI